jgi:uncharacterized protein
MSTSVNRKEALDSVQANVQDKSRIKYMLVTEAIMRALAKRLGKDVKEWGITGLLHDIDVELVEDDPSSHSRLGADIARELGANDNMVHAILCHNTAHGIPRETELDKSLFCTIHLSKLLTSAISSNPNGLATLSTKSIIDGSLKRKSSISTTDKEHIAQCSEIGLGLEEFITLGIEALKDLSSD